MDFLGSFEIQSIIDCLIDQHAYHDLCSFMLTCRRCHDVGQPILDRICEQVKNQPPDQIEDSRHIWLDRGQIHRDCDQPAMIEYSLGVTYRRSWYQHGHLHRVGDRPAVEYANGRKEWYCKGHLHRDHDQPATQMGNGQLKWYQYGRLHRDHDQPAVTTPDHGEQKWYQKGKLHRDHDRSTSGN